EADLIASKERLADDQSKPSLRAQQSRLQSVIRLLESGPVHTTRPKQPGAWHILSRRDYRKPRDVLAPGGIAPGARTSPPRQLASDAPEAQRRKALAKWITDARNPLTARVIVNRLWGYHFGAGLVRTPSDFGFQGGAPSHPELLDWLAGQLVHPDGGPAWSLK